MTPHIEFIDTEHREFLVSFATSTDREAWVWSGMVTETDRYRLSATSWAEWDSDYGTHQRFFALCSRADIADKVYGNRTRRLHLAKQGDQ